MPINVSIPHDLGRAEARRRIETGFANISRQLPGAGALASQQWEGDRLSFSAGAMGQSITGSLEVFDASVTIEIVLPGMLGTIAGALKGRVRDAAERLLLTRK